MCVRKKTEMWESIQRRVRPGDLWRPVLRALVRTSWIDNTSHAVEAGGFSHLFLQMALQQRDPTQKRNDALLDKYCGRETNKTRPYGSGLTVQFLF
jgi:hypothetical protein